jgi:mono/diheme cytochrome c family protein
MIRLPKKIPKRRYFTSSLIIFFYAVFLNGTGTFAQSITSNSQHGQILYEKHCMECHGRTGDGRGPVGYYLAVEPADFLAIESRMKSDSELISIIEEGIRSDEMHGWGEILSNQDIHDVLGYIRTLAPPPSD